MTYVETLYGHQSPISDVSTSNKNRPVTVSRGDRTVRVWKVEEDSHLVYRPGGDVGGAECVAAIRDGWFVTGHDDGRLALWKEEKKRPVATIGGPRPRGRRAARHRVLRRAGAERRPGHRFQRWIFEILEGE
jgi:ribosomal RNA-processing protein 9